MTTGNEPPVPAPHQGGPDTAPNTVADPHNLRMRDGRNRFTRNPAQAELDAQAAQLRAQGWTYQRIADHLGYKGKNTAMAAVRRAIRDACAGPAEELIALHMERIETLYERAFEIAERQHVVVSHGQIIRGDDGQPLRDSGPELAALREARAALESFWKLTGIAKPTKVEHTGVRYEIVGLADEQPGE